MCIDLCLQICKYLCMVHCLSLRYQPTNKTLSFSASGLRRSRLAERDRGGQGEQEASPLRRRDLIFIIYIYVCIFSVGVVVLA